VEKSYGVKASSLHKVPSSATRPLVGIVCAKKEPPWCLLGREVLECRWLLGRNSVGSLDNEYPPIMA